MKNNKPSNVVDNIKKMEEQREARRAAMEEMKQQKQERKDKAAKEGKICDYDFDIMIEEQRKQIDKPLNHLSSA